MGPVQREQKKADKQRRLEDAGLAEFLAEGYTGASIEKIAAAADVARGTFYLYFPDKRALFAALLARFLDPCIDALEEARAALAECRDAEDALPHYAVLGARLAGCVLEHRGPLRLYFQESRAVGAGGDLVREGQARMEVLVRRMLVRSVENGILREHDEHAVSLAIAGAIERLVWAHLEGDRKLSPPKLTQEIVVLLRDGLIRK
jgi:AcrR family transcriptional regulator